MAHPGGRPPIFDSPEEMERLIDEYFATAEKPFTMCGLALALGFVDRQSLYDYAKKKEFSCTIKKGMLKLENEYEKKTHSTTPTGSIFVLKNMGWSDKHEVDQTNHYPDGININFVSDNGES